ncbi:MAG: hypothetical protein H6620_12100 [Halobacteriovoraceae bacterium]|nr:hypothetical protein [Halobacteriovoraceae bacterium]
MFKKSFVLILAMSLFSFSAWGHGLSRGRVTAPVASVSLFPFVNVVLGGVVRAPRYHYPKKRYPSHFHHGHHHDKSPRKWNKPRGRRF